MRRLKSQTGKTVGVSTNDPLPKTTLKGGRPVRMVTTADLDPMTRKRKGVPDEKPKD